MHGEISIDFEHCCVESVLNCFEKYSSRSWTVYFSDDSRGRQDIFMNLSALS